MNENYYISSGRDNKLYTLRVRYPERVHIGGGDSTVVVRDYYVRNLSNDWELAVAKATELCKTVSIGEKFELGEIKHRTEIDHSIFPAGKYAGQSIHECKDTKYMTWVVENLALSNDWKDTVELIKELEDVRKSLQEHEDEAANRLAKTEILKKKHAPIVDMLRMLPWSEFGRSIANDLERGMTIPPRAQEIICDIIAKQFGGRRNSKAYADKFNEIWEIFTN